MAKKKFDKLAPGECFRWRIGGQRAKKRGALTFSYEDDTTFRRQVRKPMRRRQVRVVSCPENLKGARTSSRNVLTGRKWGYTCQKGLHMHGWSWMPSRFQAGARTASKELERELKKKTKAQLTKFIRDRGGRPYPDDTKSDLLVEAHNVQYEKLYPHKKCDPSDR